MDTSTEVFRINSIQYSNEISELQGALLVLNSAPQQTFTCVLDTAWREYGTINMIFAIDQCKI